MTDNDPPEPPCDGRGGPDHIGPPLLSRRRLLTLTGVAGISALALWQIRHDESSTPPPSPGWVPESTVAPPPRDMYRRPFSSTSIWNLPLGRSADYRPLHLTPPLTGYGLVLSTFLFDPTAPYRRLIDRGYWWPWRTGDAVVGRDTGHRVRVPDRWILPPPPPSAREDRPAAALQEDGRAREFQYVVRPNAGSDVSVYEGVRAAYDLRGDGLTPKGWSGAHGGSGLTTIGGTLRRGELSGPEPIRHTLALTMNLTKWGTRQSEGVSNGFRWPALWADADYDRPGTGVGYASLGMSGRPGLGEGSLLALTPEFNLSTSEFETREARKLAWTFQNYGAYVVDNAGGTGTYDVHRLNVEDGVDQESPVIDTGETTDTPFGRDMTKIFTHLAVVQDNSADTPGGSGSRRQPLAPPIGN